MKSKENIRKRKLRRRGRRSVEKGPISWGEGANGQIVALCRVLTNIQFGNKKLAKQRGGKRGGGLRFQERRGNRTEEFHTSRSCPQP